VGQAAGELDDLKTARHLALGVGKHLAVLLREQARDVVLAGAMSRAAAEIRACLLRARERKPTGRQSLLRGGMRAENTLFDFVGRVGRCVR
jgi:hypothetical protein